jgi:transcriptional regulator GlxA family with amidase domain
MCGYTPEHFSRVFKKYTGLTPMEYIWEAKIRKAKQLLLKTDKQIETICWESGFANRTHFFRKFYEADGMTPLQYRKNQK